MTQFGSADGIGISFGNASPVLRGALPVSASGTVQSVGNALASVAYPLAAMSAFALYDITVSDPIRTRAVAVSEGNDASAAWSRYWVSGTAPTEIRAGNGDGAVLARAARRAAVQVKYLAVPSAEFHYVDAVQFEKSATTAGTPTAYEEPRTIKINMRADRVNLAKNPAWNNAYGNNYGGGAGTIAMDSTVHKYGTQSLKLQPSGTGFVFSSIGGTIAVRKGVIITYSAYIYSVKDSYIDLLGFQLKEFGGAARTIAPASKLYQIFGGRWNRVSVTVPIPSDSTGTYFLQAFGAKDQFNINYDPTTALWFDGVLVEEGSETRDYFDGSFPSVDYIWENGALDTTNGSRSHLYRAFRAKQYRIDDIVSKHVPHGVPYKITYAAPPAGLT